MEITNKTHLFETGSGSNQNDPVNQNEERDLFLSLLVAQLKNQDPLSPKEGTEFVAQLAQFNSLDQLIGIRNAIERLGTEVRSATTQNSLPNL